MPSTCAVGLSSVVQPAGRREGPRISRAAGWRAPNIGFAVDCSVQSPGERARASACAEWHARWAVSACYPKDEHLEAHVRWARHRCALLRKEDAELGVDARGGFVDQAARCP